MQPAPSTALREQAVAALILPRQQPPEAVFAVSDAQFHSNAPVSLPKTRHLQAFLAVLEHVQADSPEEER
jgi:hypothetical protein